MRINAQYFKVSTSLALIVFMYTGCITFYSYEKVHFRLTDRFDKKPVQNAKIKVFYGTKGLWNRPQHSDDVYTDENGEAVLRIALESWPLGFATSIDVNDEFYDGIGNESGIIEFGQPEVIYAAKKKYLLEILQ